MEVNNGAEQQLELLGPVSKEPIGGYSIWFDRQNRTPSWAYTIPLAYHLRWGVSWHLPRGRWAPSSGNPAPFYCYCKHSRRPANPGTNPQRHCTNHPPPV